MKLTRVKDDIDEMKGTPAPLFDLLCEGVIVSTDHNTVRDRQDSTSSGDSSGKVSIIEICKVIHTCSN